ncbi:hypothetical protein U0C82_03825 [Fulvimarina sp. 2208YS6-2-32]|uniref:AP2 domain-containing protein n=1 Tax=Fulvimarina uroteuthidis TaxID=3098149 RepID=A0ABU5I0J5_9HYPH|nr:hypothetical protein [Fulvimarina sp. 2208YS6-2-32]MDY8108278.1 hypothetical protein [Fulvimarina sp. 2208YS6-2-32]
MMKKPRHKKPPLAWTVQETDDRTGGIVFTRYRSERARADAIRKGARLDYGEAYYLEACRTRWADRYAPGPVPHSAMVAEGWWFDCAGCGMRIDSDAMWEHKLDWRGVIGAGDGYTYCCAKCRADDIAMRASRKAAESAALADMRRQALAALPGVWCAPIDAKKWNGRAHAYVTRKGADEPWVTEQATVPFDFPGRKIGYGTFGFHKLGEAPRASVCNGDLAAWEAHLKNHQERAA